MTFKEYKSGAAFSAKNKITPTAAKPLSADNGNSLSADTGAVKKESSAVPTETTNTEMTETPDVAASDTSVVPTASVGTAATTQNSNLNHDQIKKQPESENLTDHVEKGDSGNAVIGQVEQSLNKTDSTSEPAASVEVHKCTQETISGSAETRKPDSDKPGAEAANTARPLQEALSPQVESKLPQDSTKDGPTLMQCNDKNDNGCENDKASVKKSPLSKENEDDNCELKNEDSMVNDEKN